jgi:hypothetical protein
METDGQISSASQEAIESAEKLYNAIQMVFPEAVTNFESKWTAWHAVCDSHTTSASIDACLRTAEFEALKKLGPKIIPFVVFKLARDAEQNSHGVFLYNAVERDPDYRLNLDEALVSKEVLRRYSTQIVELNYQRNKIVEERVRAWNEHYDRNHMFYSSTAMYTECEEYWDLLEMGPSIIAQLMVAYYHNEYGYWYELLHEIFHGRKMGAYMVQKGRLFEPWRRFFNEDNDDQVPRYVPNEADRRILNLDPAIYV